MCITMNGERLIGDAKALALSLVSSEYAAGCVREMTSSVGGDSGLFAAMKLGAWMRAAGGLHQRITIVVIAEKLATILSGRPAFERRTRPSREQYLLDLEREAFLSLCGTS